MMSFLLGSRCLNIRHILLPRQCIVKTRKAFYLNLPKDVNIYTHDNTMFVRVMGTFGCIQWFTMGYMSYVMFENMPAFFKWIPVEQSDNSQEWKTKSKRLPRADWPYRLGFSLFTFSAACAVLAASWIYCLRCVSSITLLKSSDNVLLKTYTPIGTLWDTIAPISQVSSVQSRTGSTGFVPIKLKDHYFNFIVDKSGHFSQPSLFDRTVGIKRDFGMTKK